MSQYANTLSPKDKDIDKFTTYIPPTDNSSSTMLKGITDMAGNLISSFGGGYARSEAFEQSGKDTTHLEAQYSIEHYDEDLQKKSPTITDDMSEVEKSRARAQIRDFKDDALKKFATDDRKLQAFVNAGRITSLEANALRQKRIQESLSNPVLAMFSEEFLRATKMHIGSPKLAEEFFDAPIQEQAMDAAEKQVVGDASENGLEYYVNYYMKKRRGVTREEVMGDAQVAYKAHLQMLQTAKDAQNLEATADQRANAFVNLGMQSSAPIWETLMDIGSQSGVVDEKSMIALKTQIGESRRQAIMGITQQMGTLDTTKQNFVLNNINNFFDELEKQASSVDGVKAMQASADVMKAKYSIMDSNANINFFEHMPAAAALQAVNPYLFEEVYKMSPSQLHMLNQSNPHWRNLSTYFNLTDPVQLMKPIGNYVAGKASPQETSLAVAAIGQNPSMMNEMDTNKVANDFAKEFARVDSGASLSIFSTKGQWDAAMQKPEGKQVAMAAIKGNAQRLRALQYGAGSGMPEHIAITDNTIAGIQFRFDIDTGNNVQLNETVKDQIGQTCKIFNAYPELLQEMGYDSVDAYFTDVFAK